MDSNLSKMIQASGIITGDVDWNNYASTGVYKVQNTNMTAENNAPVGMYKYGTLEVIRSEMAGEARRVQVYYPDVSDANNVMAVRTSNNNNWQKWRAISGTLLE